jgi:phosphopantothenate synthetase
VHRKLSNALGYFRRSFRATPNADEALVNLGAAFEVLLTDHYSPGVGGRITRRLKLALSGEPDADALCASVDDLYRARSEAIHTGETDLAVDLRKAQRTFGTAFLTMVERLPRVPRTSNDPIADMLGDTERDAVAAATGMVKSEAV